LIIGFSLILNTLLVFLLFAITLLALKLIRNPRSKVNKVIPVVQINPIEAGALTKLVLENSISDNLTMLNDQERVILKLGGVKLYEHKILKNKGKYQGISLRVLSGLSYRIGEFSNKAKETLINTDNGEFFFTSDRFIFLGQKGSVEVSLKKVLKVDINKGMLEVHQTGRAKVILFGGLQEAWENYITLFDSNEQIKRDDGLSRISFIATELLK
jgi:hypothetical protein|tara:strand:- start:3272 stop:3913 length:642 start_codon:yes stop_codon:yes gene_type:complete